MELANNSSNIVGAGGVSANLNSDPSLCLQDLVAGVGTGSVDQHRSTAVTYTPQHPAAHHHYHQLGHHPLQGIQHHHPLHHHSLTTTGVHQTAEVSNLDINQHVLNHAHHQARFSASINPEVSFMASHHPTPQQLMSSVGSVAAAAVVAATANTGGNHSRRSISSSISCNMTSASSTSNGDKIKRGTCNFLPLILQSTIVVYLDASNSLYCRLNVIILLKLSVLNGYLEYIYHHKKII